MDKDGVSPVVGTILLIAITVALAAIVAMLISGLGGRGAPTITVWSSFENKPVSEERSYVTVNDELRIESSNFSENLPIEYKIVLIYDGNIDNVSENQIYSTLGIVEVKCSGIGESRISANGSFRAVEVVSPFEYDMKEIEENALHAQEGANKAQLITVIIAIVTVLVNVILTVKYRKLNTPEPQKQSKDKKSVKARIKASPNLSPLS